jgi:exodeoxyribonuclease VII large subunit
VKRRLETLSMKLSYLESRIIHPKRRLENLRLMLDDRIERLSMALGRRLERYRSFHAHLGDRLLYLNPEARIQKYRVDLSRLCRDLLMSQHRILDGYRLRFQHHLSRLETLSPLAVLKRGYSITYRMPDRKVIRSFREVGRGQRVLVRLADGRIECLVEGAEDAEE